MRRRRAPVETYVGLTICSSSPEGKEELEEGLRGKGPSGPEVSDHNRRIHAGDTACCPLQSPVDYTLCYLQHIVM